MSDIRLFKQADGKWVMLDAQSVAVEKSLQTLIEKNLATFLGVTPLASKYTTGKVHAGRIDTLGIDENLRPVIIEYKRALNENVINQGLFYLDWLLDHKAEFKLFVMEKVDKETADGIEWASPRLLCIAGDFTKYDVHSVAQMNRTIELIRYRRYGDDLLLFELVNAVEGTPEPIKPGAGGKGSYKTVTEYLAEADDPLRDRFEALKAFLTGLGDDVQMTTLKYYIAFKRIKNFACVTPQPGSGNLVVWVKVDPTTVELEDGFTRDVSGVGHHGRGDLEISIKSMQNLETAKPLLLKSYEGS